MMDDIKNKTCKRQDELTGTIHTKWAGQPVCVYETLDSTNLEAARLAGQGAAHGTVVAARQQTAGKGRRGRSWDSPVGNNLYFSLLLRPEFTPDKAPMVTLVMAVAAARAVQQVADCKVEIKWPNDLVAHGKKLCGILTEMHLCAAQPAIDYVIVGVGVNVGAREFESDLQDKATTLENICGAGIDSMVLLEAVLVEFEGLYEAFVQAGDLQPVLEEYQALLVNLNREVTVLDPKGAYHGVARGITGTGELVVDTEDGERREIYAGEVSVRGIYGYV